MNYNEQLQKLQKKVSQEKSVEAKLRELKSQKDELNSRVYVFKKTMKNEQDDVERLERTSLSSVFYEIIGRKDEMLDKEKAEAYAAKVKYDAAVEELRLIEEDLHRMETQLCDIIACKKEYDLLLEEKKEAIKAVNSIEAERIFQIEEKIVEQKNHQKEIKEAVSAGTRALGTAVSILSDLDSAQNWGTYDLVNGGLIAGLAKHSYLDEAQNKVTTLQSQLRKFKTELTDITIQADMKVNVDGFLRFADYFYDGLFSDWAVLDRIGQSKSSVHSVKTKIENVLSQLDRMDRAVEQMIKHLQMERDSIVKSVDM